ncbi:SPASM domain-containing protein, partial [Romboutsia timonensis]
NMNIKKEKCDLGVYILSIKATGDIVACPGFDLSLGNINQSSLESILSSKKADILLDLKSPTKSLCGDCSSIQECKGCHAVPLNKKSNVCSWKIQNKNILDEFLEVEKVTY